MPDLVLFFFIFLGAICRIVRDIFWAFTTPKRQRHVRLLDMLMLTLISNVNFGVEDETILQFEK